MKTQLLVASLALIFATQANAEANIEKVCVNNKTGAVRFTDMLSGKKAECKKKESAEFYAELQQVFDSAGTFVGYAYPDSSVNPYNTDVFVPSVGTELYIHPFVVPQTGAGNIITGMAVGNQNYKESIFADQNCQGAQYISIWNYGMNYRDPITLTPYTEKGSATIAAPKSYEVFEYDAITKSWQSWGCTNRTFEAGAYLISSPQPLSLPFTTLQLPLVFGLLK